MKVAAISRDLMDRSKLTAAFPGIDVVRSVDDVPEAEAEVVLVDLSIDGALDAAIEGGATVVAFGSHVDAETLEAARARGVTALPRSVFFRRLAEGTLLE